VPAVKIETGRWLNGQADFLETSGVGQELNYSGQFVASFFYWLFIVPHFWRRADTGENFVKRRAKTGEGGTTQ
jgi:hypothetical protein